VTKQRDTTEVAQTKVRLKVRQHGLFEGHCGPRRGDIVDVEDINVNRYLSQGIAQLDLDGPLGHPYDQVQPRRTQSGWGWIK
jgi:hypothetical protein